MTKKKPPQPNLNKLSTEEYGSLLQETIGSFAAGQPSPLLRQASTSSPGAKIEQLQTLRKKLGTD